tara:strand:- start:5766 stop:6959 length:1194 start_codon:yes stop_codon:yes gene_type:complete
MVIRVLAIGDLGNIVRTLRKYTKKSKIHLINYPKDGMGEYYYYDDVETFENWKVMDNLKKINSIKNDFDICLTIGSERLPYLADINYIGYYLGRDIDVPKWKKNSAEQWQTEPLFKLNSLERKFYWNAFRNAIAHVAGMWQFEFLQKYTENGINSAAIPIDTEEFNQNVEPIKLEKKKFTFFHPNRFEKGRGSDLLWDAIKLCRTDFEIIGIDYPLQATQEERDFNKKLLDNKPKQLKMIPPIKREEIPKYYRYADAVIANLTIGTFEMVGLESVMCGTPVIQYTDKSKKIVINGKEIESPFLPFSKDPKAIAEIIDKVVMEEKFRQELFENEYRFVNQVANPEKCAEWWDNLFEELITKHKTIHKNSSKIRIKLRIYGFLIANRLYLKKLKKAFSS